MFPIKYIENNLVFNHDGECFAYYVVLVYKCGQEKSNNLYY